MQVVDTERLFAVIDELDLPEGQYAVFGGACLTAYGLRPTSDIEVFVTPNLYITLSQERGWNEHITGSTRAAYLTRSIQAVPVLAFVTCGSDKWIPNVRAYLQSPEIVNGKPFMPLRDMYDWKAATARPKDLDDLRLIERYWENQ